MVSVLRPHLHIRPTQQCNDFHIWWTSYDSNQFSSCVLLTKAGETIKHLAAAHCIHCIWCAKVPTENLAEGCKEIKTRPLRHVDRVTETNRGLVILPSIGYRWACNQWSISVKFSGGIHVTQTRKRHSRQRRQKAEEEGDEERTERTGRKNDKRGEGESKKEKRSRKRNGREIKRVGRKRQHGGEGTAIKRVCVCVSVCVHALRMFNIWICL